ncbi:MAG: hypothetical protein WCI63_00130 [bacterium]
MNRKVFFILLGVEVILLAGTIVGIYSLRNKAFVTESKDLTNKAATVKIDIDKLKLDKDSKDYLPSDVVKNFIVEFKADSAEKTKLYLSSGQKNMDVKTVLSVDKEFDKVNVIETTYTVENDMATVNLKGSWPTEDATFEKTINLVKEDGLWKINEIKGV